jgi:hypothetical protein
MRKKRVAFLAALVVCMIIASLIAIKGYSYYKYKYVFDDIKSLIKTAQENPYARDLYIEGDLISNPHKIFVYKKVSLQEVYKIVREIINSNIQEEIDADGEATYIYFGDYVITHQGGAALNKIEQNGEMTTIKYCVPAGEYISSKVHELRSKAQGSK